MTRPSEIRTGAAAVVHAVACVGTTAIFGVPRSSAAIERAIDEAVNVRFVAAVHEQGAGHMAQGYARATGRPGVVVLQAGYPAMHLVTPLGDAWMDSTPVVCLVEHRGDELDEYRPRLAELAGPITKRSWIATDAGELRDAMIAAFDEANHRPLAGRSSWRRRRPRSRPTWRARPAPMSPAVGWPNSIEQPSSRRRRSSGRRRPRFSMWAVS